ncbi:MAG: HypC/HybG/HupF family hydrogenase formation chaperone [Akkermansia sp.]
MCLAVPGKIIEIKHSDPLFPIGIVDFGGITREVNLACVPEALIGNYVIVHVGMALSIMDEDQALMARNDLRQLVADTPEQSIQQRDSQITHD